MPSKRVVGAGAMGTGIAHTAAQAGTPGFAVNRILLPLMLEAARVVKEDIATVPDVDQAIKLGLNHLRQTQYRPPRVIKNLVRSGRIGRKVGKGFYSYR